MKALFFKMNPKLLLYSYFVENYGISKIDNFFSNFLNNKLGLSASGKKLVDKYTEKWIVFLSEWVQKNHCI